MGVEIDVRARRGEFDFAGARPVPELCERVFALRGVKVVQLTFELFDLMAHSENSWASLTKNGDCVNFFSQYEASAWKSDSELVCWTAGGRFNILCAMETILANALGREESQLAAAEKRDLLARLLERLAHEIRNPLSSLDIHVQLLEEDLAALTPEARKPLASRLEIIHGELHRLENIVERFLRLAGPSELDLEPVEIQNLVAHVCNLLRAEASTRQIEIVAQIENELPAINADSVRLTQALMNLVINALQAVERNGRVEVAAAKSSAGDALLLRVRDSGPGIPAEKLTDIFDPYYSTKPEGNGLGLWIAQQIAAAHGGLLNAGNVPDGGAIFTLTLPLNRKEISGE